MRPSPPASSLDRHPPPGTGPADAASAATDPAAYCREARRLRGRWAGQPERLQRSLLDLARRRDAAARAGGSCGPVRAVRASQHTIRPTTGPAFQPVVAAPLAAPGVVADQFRAMVAARLDQTAGGPILRYSQRQALLRAATRLGVGRFEANLMIAAVQHRLASIECPPSDIPDSEHDPRPARGFGMTVGCVGLIAAVEGLLALGLWWATRT